MLSRQESWMFEQSKIICCQSLSEQFLAPLISISVFHRYNLILRQEKTGSWPILKVNRIASLEIHKVQVGYEHNSYFQREKTNCRIPNLVYRNLPVFQSKLLNKVYFSSHHSAFSNVSLREMAYESLFPQKNTDLESLGLSQCAVDPD